MQSAYETACARADGGVVLDAVLLLRRRLVDLGFDPEEAPWWKVHRVGRDRRISSFTTLCRPCHAEQWADQRVVGSP